MSVSVYQSFACAGGLVVSAELACLLYRERAAYGEIEERLRIVSFQILKGVWGGRNYPIVWYEADWAKINESFVYDEHLTSELAASVQNRSGQESRLARIEKVFRDLGRSEVMDSLQRAVQDTVSMPRRESVEIEISSDRFAEIHCVAICFTPKERFWRRGGLLRSAVSLVVLNLAVANCGLANPLLIACAGPTKTILVWNFFDRAADAGEHVRITRPR